MIQLVKEMEGHGHLMRQYTKLLLSLLLAFGASAQVAADPLRQYVGQYLSQDKEYLIEVTKCSASMTKLCERTRGAPENERLCGRIIKHFEENGGKKENEGRYVSCLATLSTANQTASRCNEYGLEGAGWSWRFNSQGSMFARFREGRFEFRACAPLRGYGECELTTKTLFDLVRDTVACGNVHWTKQ